MLICFFFIEDEKKRRQVIGKAKIGGRFDLIDTEGNPVKSEDFHGSWVLLYFGFTHCPDICPDQLDKLSLAISMLSKFTLQQMGMLLWLLEASAIRK